MSPDVREEWQDDEVNLLDYWRVLRRRTRMILGLTFVSVFMAGFYSYFIMTKIYESTASILGPKESGGGGQVWRLPSPHREPGNFSEALSPVAGAIGMSSSPS